MDFVDELGEKDYSKAYLNSIASSGGSRLSSGRTNTKA